MAVSSKANYVMLKWARKTAGLSIEDVAVAETWPVEKIEEWEQGDRSPSLPQLRRLAKRYKRPLMVFYLPEPPTDFNVVKDFRRLPEHAAKKLSPGLRYALRTAQERQRWAAEYLRDEGEPSFALVGSATVKDDTTQLGKQLREFLGVSVHDQVTCQSASQAYGVWKTACETAGIFVFQASGIDVTEFRGCALPDTYAPVALVNARDSYTARTFTLLHEIAHILLGISAITGGTHPPLDSRKGTIEYFCNSLAAEVLIPRDDLAQNLPKGWQQDDKRAVADAAKRYHVSRLAMAVRLVEIGAADKSWLASRWQYFKSKPSEPSSGPVPQYIRAAARNGAAFSRLAVSAYEAGYIHGGQLTALLHLSLKHLGRLVQQLYPNRVETP